MVVNFPGTNSSSHWLLWGQDLKTLKILFTPEHFKIANGKMLMIRKGVLHNSNSKKIRPNKLKRVLYTGTASSFWFFLYSVGKKKRGGEGRKSMRNHAAVFQYKCITTSIFFRSTALPCFIYIFLYTNATSLNSQMLSIQWHGLWQSCFPLFGLSHHHMSPASWCPSLSSLPHQSQKGIHITLKHPNGSHAETVPWNN